MSTTIPVNEMFATVQGEAGWTGTPSLFIRLQGCAVGCPWCDTKHTWELDPANLITAGQMVRKTNDSHQYAQMPVSEIIGYVDAAECRHVVITGGEPCDYDLERLTKAILATGRTVQIETSGTSPVRVAPGAWVTLSPKIDMPGGKVVLHTAVERANEIKMPVGKSADIDKLTDFLRGHDIEPLKEPGARKLPIVWLQPLSQSAKATELCVRAATQHGWRVSIQTHKYMGVR